MKIEILREVYKPEDTCESHIQLMIINGKDLKDCLLKMAEHVRCWIDPIEDADASLINCLITLNESNGINVDYIYYIRDVNTGEFYFGKTFTIKEY